jgi:hypothetical protein
MIIIRSDYSMMMCGDRDDERRCSSGCDQHEEKNVVD